MTNAEIAVIVTRLDAMAGDLEEIKGHAEKAAGKAADRDEKTDERVRALEGWRARMTGAMAVLALLGPIVSGVVTALVVTRLT